MTRLLSLVLSIPPRSYDDRKVSGRCARRGCEAECQEDHLLCPVCAELHRLANAKSMSRLRRYRRLQATLWAAFHRVDK
jgi:hypothetical protein